MVKPIQIRRLAPYVALWCVLHASPAPTHEGHDHAPAPTAGAPSAQAASDAFELVAVAGTGELVLHLDRFATNEPVEGVGLDVETPNGPAVARPAGAGMYRLQAPWLAKPGRYHLIVTVNANATSDVLPLMLDIPAGATSGPAAPRRNADGAIIMPKPSQRLLGVRTRVAEPVSERASVELMGRITVDPNASARVRAVRDGIVEAGEAGIPHIGQRVARGDTLAWLVPVLPAAEETQLRQKLLDVERELALLMPRAEHASVVNPNMPMGDAAVALLQEIQIQAQALSKQAELIKAALAQRIEIKAPIAGTIASTSLRAGELAAARDVLVEIVDPDKARVEAYAFGSAPHAIDGATAATDDGRSFALTYLGRGPVLRAQAIPLLFQVEQPGRLDFGAAVRVHVRDGGKRQGFKLPRAAVQRSGGAPVIFEHAGAETFVPRRVTVEPLDGEHVLVNGELSAGMRIVTAGAVFIAQVR